MSDQKAWAICVAVAVVAICITVSLAIYLPIHNSTLRTEACIKAGGSYVQVPERTTMECRR